MIIIWNQVTRFSQIIAIILFVCVYYYGFYLGGQVRTAKILGESVNEAVFQCDAGRSIRTIFYKRGAHVFPSGMEDHFLLQTISASGARYANKDESLVFWNKGNEGLVMRDNKMDTTYTNCKTADNGTN